MDILQTTETGNQEPTEPQLASTFRLIPNKAKEDKEPDKDEQSLQVNILAPLASCSVVVVMVVVMVGMHLGSVESVREPIWEPRGWAVHCSVREPLEIKQRRNTTTEGCRQSEVPEPCSSHGGRPTQPTKTTHETESVMMEMVWFWRRSSLRPLASRTVWDVEAWNGL